MKTFKIFGYGSLVNESSIRRTVPNAKNITPVRINGFIRVFNLPTKRKKCVLNGVPVAVLNIEKSEFNQEMNGVVFDMDETHFEDLKARESSYELFELEAYDYDGNLHRAYTFRARHFEAYDYQFESPTQEEYLRLCLDGAKNFGEEFFEDFLNTTHIGRKTLKELGIK
jgi:cation transport regulator ChaC